MARRVRAKLLVRFFDRDPAKARQLRDAMRGRAFVRRDESGRVVAEFEFDRERGPADR